MDPVSPFGTVPKGETGSIVERAPGARRRYAASSEWSCSLTESAATSRTVSPR